MIANEALPLLALRKLAANTGKIPPLAVARGQLNGNRLSQELLEGNVLLTGGDQLQLALKQLGKPFVAGPAGQQQGVFAERRGDRQHRPLRSRG